MDKEELEKLNRQFLEALLLLSESAKKFRYYETSHRAKVRDAVVGDDALDLRVIRANGDALTKAEVNAEIASRLEAFIKRGTHLEVETPLPAPIFSSEKIHQLTEVVLHEARHEGADSSCDYGDAEQIVKAIIAHLPSEEGVDIVLLKRMYNTGRQTGELLGAAEISDRIRAIPQSDEWDGRWSSAVNRVADLIPTWLPVLTPPGESDGK